MAKLKDEIPVKLVRASDKFREAFDDAFIRLSDAQAELKEARVLFKKAQADYSRALKDGDRFDPSLSEPF